MYMITCMFIITVNCSLLKILQLKKTLTNFQRKSEKENLLSQTIVGEEDDIKNQSKGKQEKEMEGNGVNNIGE